jgi:hypothetical protein
VVHILAVVLIVFFIQALLLGFAHWEGNRWHLKTGVAGLFALAIFAAWAFGFALSCLGRTYSYSGFTALLFTANFIPACFLVY